MLSIGRFLLCGILSGAAHVLAADPPADGAALLFEAGYRVANGDKYPEWKPGTEFKAKRDEMMMKKMKTNRQWTRTAALIFLAIQCPPKNFAFISVQ